MTPVEAIASVRLDYTKNNDGVGMGGIRQLVPIGRKEGKLLVRLNPAFYDHSLNAPVAQLITLYYAWPTVGFAKDPDYLQQAVLNIYNHTDYHALKESLK